MQEKGIPVTSTSFQHLISLQGEYPVIQALLEYRSLSARIDTFALVLPERIREHPGFAKTSNGQEVVEVSTTKF
ncbi:hypothetical protein [Microcoleus sp.]|uniref:hypothetical protein n=1 Tax=Microcoleus sp. TaxID=44472 RepID=UPI00403E9018